MFDVAVALALALAVAAVALLVAAIVARGAFTSFVLTALLAALAEVQVLALVLSPVDAVGRPGYAICEAALLGLALIVWHGAGRPFPRGPDLGFLRKDPTLLALAAGVALFVLYEFFLCLTVPPNNWESLTYHLARAAAWYQHGGVYWIANPPTEKQNAFPAGAELAVLWSFVAVGSDRVAALPQFLAQLSAMGAAFGIAVRIGFARPSAAFAALLVPTFALVALESTTTQNDLVVASLVATSAYFVLAAARSGGDDREAAVAGVALALALGTKLTATLAVPGILALALAARLPQRRAVVACVAFAFAFAAFDSWLYIENGVNTGHVFGSGGGRVEHAPNLTPSGFIATVLRILYRFLNLAGAPWHGLGPIASLAALAVLVAVSALVWHSGPRPLTPALTAGAAALALPLLVTVVAAGARVTLTTLAVPIAPAGTSEGTFSWSVSARVHEDFAYAGAVGLPLLAVVAAALRPRFARRNPTRAALAGGFLLFPVSLAAFYRFNEFVGRYMLVAIIFAAPLFAGVYRWRAVAVGVAAFALVTLALTNVRNELKPMSRTPWSLSRAEVLGLQGWQAGIATGVEALDRTVQSNACVGAMLAGDEAAYPLFGPHLLRHVSYIAVPPAGSTASPRESAVIVGPELEGVSFGAGWRVTSLGGYWRLAVRGQRQSAFSCR